MAAGKSMRKLIGAITASSNSTPNACSHHQGAPNTTARTVLPRNNHLRNSHKLKTQAAQIPAASPNRPHRNRSRRTNMSPVTQPGRNRGVSQIWQTRRARRKKPTCARGGNRSHDKPYTATLSTTDYLTDNIPTPRQYPTQRRPHHRTDRNGHIPPLCFSEYSWHLSPRSHVVGTGHHAPTRDRHHGDVGDKSPMEHQKQSRIRPDNERDLRDVSHYIHVRTGAVLQLVPTRWKPAHNQWSDNGKSGISGLGPMGTILLVPSAGEER